MLSMCSRTTLPFDLNSLDILMIWHIDVLCTKLTSTTLPETLAAPYQFYWHLVLQLMRVWSSARPHMLCRFRFLSGISGDLLLSYEVGCARQHCSRESSNVRHAIQVPIINFSMQRLSLRLQFCPAESVSQSETARASRCDNQKSLRGTCTFSLQSYLSSTDWKKSFLWTVLRRTCDIQAASRSILTTFQAVNFASAHAGYPVTSDQDCHSRYSIVIVRYDGFLTRVFLDVFREIRPIRPGLLERMCKFGNRCYPQSFHTYSESPIGGYHLVVWPNSTQCI